MIALSGPLGRPRDGGGVDGVLGGRFGLGFVEHHEVDDPVRKIDRFVNDDSPPLNPRTERTHERSTTTKYEGALEANDVFTRRRR